MKVPVKRVALLAIAVSSLWVAPADAATRPKAGAACTKVGVVVGGLRCTTVGKRKIYRPVPAVTTAAPTTAAPTTAAPTRAPSTSATSATSSPTTLPATNPTAAPTTIAQGAAPVKVELSEWAIKAPQVYKAGLLSFDLKNIGEFAHDFVVVEGISYEDLPKLRAGAVEEASVKIAGRTKRFAAGEAGKLDVQLKPGGYVFYCSIIFGPTNHAEKGQVLSVTVQ